MHGFDGERRKHNGHKNTTLLLDSLPGHLVGELHLEDASSRSTPRNDIFK